MASILLCCTPAHGHVYPLLTVGRDLLDHGHEVRVLTGRAYEDTVLAAGLDFVRFPPQADLDVVHPNDVFPERAAMRPIPQLKFSVLEFFIRPIRPQVRAIDDAIAERPTDVIVTEMMCFGAVAVARRPRASRPAVVTLGIFPLALGDPDVAPYGFGIPRCVARWVGPGTGCWRPWQHGCSRRFCARERRRSPPSTAHRRQRSA